MMANEVAQLIDIKEFSSKSVGFWLNFLSL